MVPLAPAATETLSVGCMEAPPFLLKTECSWKRLLGSTSFCQYSVISPRALLVPFQEIHMILCLLFLLSALFTDTWLQSYGGLALGHDQSWTKKCSRLCQSQAQMVQEVDQNGHFVCLLAFTK